MKKNINTPDEDSRNARIERLRAHPVAQRAAETSTFLHANLQFRGVVGCDSTPADLDLAPINAEPL
jgi:hypothetical protein